MNRLTIRETGEAKDHITISEILDKLRYYENLEEDERLVVLPCNEDDWVYCLRKSRNSWNIDKKHFKVGMTDKIGWSVFLTFEEAEKAVREKQE